MATERTVKLIAKLQDGISPGLRTLAQGAAGVATAIAGITAAVLAAAKKLSDYGAQIYDTAAAMNLSVEATQAFGYIADQTGSSLQGLTGSVRALNTMLRQGATEGSEQARMMQQLGLSYAELMAMSPEDAFLAVTDAIGGITNEMEQNVAAATLLGNRYGTQVVGALNQTDGSLRSLMDSFNESGRAMTGEQIDALKKYSDAMTDFEYSIKALTADALVPLLPVLMEGLDTFAELSKSVMPDLVVGIGAAVEITGWFLTAMKDSIEAVGGAKEAVLILAGAYAGLKIAKTIDLIQTGQLTIAHIALAAAKVKAAIAAAGLAASIGPALLGAAIVFTATQLSGLYGAMNEATQATNDLEAATIRLEDTNQQVVAILTAVQRESDMSKDRLVALNDQLLRMDQECEDVQVALGYMARRIAEADAAAASLAGSAEEAKAALAGSRAETIAKARDLTQLSEQELQAAIATQQLSLAMLEQQHAMAGGKTPLQGQIEAIRAYIGELKNAYKELARSGGLDATDPVIVGLGSSATRKPAAEELKHNLKELAEEAARIEAERYAEAKARAVNYANFQRALMEEEAGLRKQEQTARMEAEQQRIQMIAQGTASLFTGIALAATQGQDALDAWFDRFKQRLLELTISSAFQALLGVLTPGGFLGGIFGGLFGRAGGGIVPGAVGGRVVGGSPGLQGDKVPMLLEPGELVLSRNQCRDMARAGSGGGVSITVDYRPILSTASRAEIGRLGLEVRNALRKVGVDI